MTEKPRYATLKDLSMAIEKLEAKVPSRWEVRTLILGAIVVNNYDVPHTITASAIGIGALGLVGKSLLAFFSRN